MINCFIQIDLSEAVLDYVGAIITASSDKPIGAGQHQCH
jgi:hypothetical protein